MIDTESRKICPIGRRRVVILVTMMALLVACSSPGAVMDSPTASVSVGSPPESTGTASRVGTLDRQVAEVTPIVMKPTHAADGLGGTEWTLTSLGGRRAAKDTRITLEFNNGVIEGQSGCNYYGATYEAKQGRLRLSRLGVSDMVCPDPAGVMEQEAAYTRLLLRAANYRVSRDRLEIQDKRRKTLLVYSRDV